MIEAFTGYPGSGKTFALTYRAYKDIKRGRKVFTNYPVKGAYRVTFEDLINYTFPQNSTVIIDESGRWFNSRNWSKLPAAVFDLFTLHRHMKLDLIVAVQNFNRIDVALREVIELVWWARNYWFLPYFIYDGYYDVEKLGMKGEADRRMLIPKFTRARKLYDTHVMAKEVVKDEIPLIPWTKEEVKMKERKKWYMDDRVHRIRLKMMDVQQAFYDLVSPYQVKLRQAKKRFRYRMRRMFR